MNSDHLIDVEKIAHSRKGGDKIPRFVLNWLKKVIHQDFFNDFFQHGYEGAEFCHKAIEKLDLKVNVEGQENLALIPEGAKITFAANHPMGGIDGVILTSILLDHCDGKARLLVNDFLMSIKGLAPLCIPINKMGGQARNLPQLIREAFDSENGMMVFPAGLCSRKIDGEITDLPWKKTFITESVRTGRYVVPVYFDGKNSKRFYRVAALCKALKLKVNLATFLLPDELYRGQHSSVRVVIGKPIAPETFDSSRTPLEWASEVRRIAYNLKG